MSGLATVQAVHAALPDGGLFHEKEWRIAPRPFEISSEFGEELDKLGYRLVLFLKACDQLYRQSAKGRQPAWVADLLDAGKPLELVAFQRDHGIAGDIPRVIRPDLIEQVIRPVIPAQFLDDNYDIFVNPTGKFVLGGPHADTGLTGRKIIVDTYGGMGRHGGGAFSGKDPSKVDRSGAYAARWVAKHVVASGAATRCEVQVAYAIGVAHPVSILVETFGTEVVPNAVIEEAVRNVFDLRPAAIVRDLDLKRPIYRKTAAYGHFGRALPQFSWEHTSRLADFKAAVKL
mgnify:CR=1 FL=1